MAVGGKHGRTISQIEKQQKLAKMRAEGRRLKRRGRGVDVVEKTVREILIPENSIEQIKREILKMPCITPSTVALKFNLRLSVAKDLLEDLTRRGDLILISKNRRIAIYKPVAAG
ncbi:MAG: hypothetical protein DRJ21_01255 [Candidatus Methanomethylicota archaeon]|uniref:30S ribosomal protein S25e n=1 Tax=Thermoproteota archaeon TaxID=2056631 RepID=A0A497EW27_9CREN|nr:MAG: hypothetical protein DRJ21_01255 [Candidatus Verstraetearchaeota archaeon]